MTFKKEIALILLIKIVLLFTLWLAFFDHSMTDENVASKVNRAILNR